MDEPVRLPHLGGVAEVTKSAWQLRNERALKIRADKIDRELALKGGPLSALNHTGNGRGKREQFAAAWRKLAARQKEYLQALMQYEWNAGAAMRALIKTGVKIKKTAPTRWYNTSEIYAFVYDAMKARARAAVVDKDKLVLDAEFIRQQAMKPKPILYKGEATGFFENKPDTALRAVELLMKTQKMLGNDQEQQTQGNGPNLVIQIVQADNKVVEMVSGVTIDMPVPSAD